MTINGDGSRVVGIIAEYNPFHNGHLYHLEESKRLAGADTAVAVMSGDFVQRGEPALLDKWKRAEAAVRNGVDLVLELPFLYACNSAEHFAMGAVKLLHAMGVVGALSFGSESGDLGELGEAARVLGSEEREFKGYLKEAVDLGLSFPAARQAALEKVAGKVAAALLKSPNNILAIEYLKQLDRQGSGMCPLTVKRKGAGYDETAPRVGMAGASAIRRLFLSGQGAEALGYLPEAGREGYAALGGLSAGGTGSGAVAGSKYTGTPPVKGIVSLDDFFPMVAYAARTKTVEELAEVLSASEGLENRLKGALDKAGDMGGLIRAVKSKRYTQTRVCRFLLHNMFGVTKSLFREASAVASIGYFRVLAMNGRGQALLRRVKGSSQDAVVTNLSRARLGSSEGARVLELDVLASDLYNLVAYGSFRAMSDYRRRPFVG